MSKENFDWKVGRNDRFGLEQFGLMTETEAIQKEGNRAQQDKPIKIVLKCMLGNCLILTALCINNNKIFLIVKQNRDIST